ncbi:acyltransferase family protein [Catellatospora sichuanensis]|uniref:acyltransferase family protein n=1 Tax=Catellatospora sichuanensis TaxID=1969805 RepID=UPI001FE3C5C9|nr:acyltransferase family protein [Catellatospora sichuanensis]
MTAPRLRELRDLAAATPQRRVRYVDLLRAVAITAVVVGHWLAVVVVADERGLHGHTLLADLPWTHALTWLFQVIPVFFLVGGFANAASLHRWRERGAAVTGWLLARSARLVSPTTVLLATLCGAAALARLAGADPVLVATAVWLAAIPLWFLAAYLALILLTPPLYATYQRMGVWLPVLLAGLVAAGDAVRWHSPGSALPFANFLLAPLVAYTAGFAWQAGHLPSRPCACATVLVGGLGALLLLTVAGPYPVSMINVPGAVVQNSSPPTVALLALASAQLGLVLLLYERGERLLRERARVWVAVVAANTVIMTVFLWHMSAVVLVVLALYATGVLPAAPPGTASWLLTRLPWLALLSVMLAGLVAVFGRFETIPAPRLATQRGLATPGLPGSPAKWTAAVIFGYAATALGLAGIASAGRVDHGLFGLATVPVLVFFAGAALLRTARAAGGPVSRLGQGDIGPVSGR